MAGLNVPMYDPRLVQPMREELTRIGFEELRTPAEVDQVLGTTNDTTLVVVNSVCGCAARNARPAATLALQHARRPKRLLTVFAGQDAEATERARSYFTGYPPSSPQMGLFKDGALVFMSGRRNVGDGYMMTTRFMHPTAKLGFHGPFNGGEAESKDPQLLAKAQRAGVNAVADLVD